MDKTEEKPVYKTVEKSAEKCGKGRPPPRHARHYFASTRTARSSPTCPTTIQTIQGQNSFLKISGGSENKLRGSEKTDATLRGHVCFFCSRPEGQPAPATVAERFHWPRPNAARRPTFAPQAANRRAAPLRDSRFMLKFANCRCQARSAPPAQNLTHHTSWY